MPDTLSTTKAKKSQKKTEPGQAQAKKAVHPHNREVGKRGEEIACRYLKREGCSIIERNWRSAFGEADIIVREGEDLVFVEVKTRTNERQGLPEESVTKARRKRYENIALAYLSNHCLPSCRVRFDVVAVLLIGQSRAMLRHHRDAFACGM
jgi:putative endonuclease